MLFEFLCKGGLLSGTKSEGIYSIQLVDFSVSKKDTTFNKCFEFYESKKHEIKKKKADVNLKKFPVISVLSVGIWLILIFYYLYIEPTNEIIPLAVIIILVWGYYNFKLEYPQIPSNCLTLLGKKCLKLLEIDETKTIKFKAREEIGTSYATSISNNKYEIHIKIQNDVFELKSLIHEVIHIKFDHTNFPEWTKLFLYAPLEFQANMYEIYLFLRKDMLNELKNMEQN